MQYGFFDDQAHEYVITRPDTPAPWANYLGSPEYGALISNNAGGYSFVKSGANGRILRYVFNQFDQPGRYLYLRDNETGDFWSASWQPVGKDLDTYKSECRHGMGYTVMTADYGGIHSEAAYYVPLKGTHEVWRLTVRNDSDRPRTLTLTGYAEFTSHGNYEQDQVNLQYSQFVTRTLFDENRVRQQIHGNLDAAESEVDAKSVIERFFGLAGAEVSSYCGDRAEFLGPYRDYGNPVGVERGNLWNQLGYNGNSCGALSTAVSLEPGEAVTVAFLLGEKYERESAALLKAYQDPEAVCERELEALKQFWHGKLSRFQVKTPCPEFDTMINTWNAYNSFITFTWSRAASFIYCGLRNGYGYRDTVQDIQGVIHLEPEAAAEKIRFMLSAQVNHGGGLPLVKFTHDPGHEDTPEDASYIQETGHPAYRADDALWLFPTVYKYIAETGNVGFLDEVIPFANRDEGTVYEHLKRALDFSLKHLGPHGMPAGLHADWNDCLRLGAAGESSFVAFQFYYAFTVLREFAACEKDSGYLAWLEREQGKLKTLLNDLCWDGDRFIRGFTEAGEVIGNHSAPEANLWLNPQSWAVISGLADGKQAELAMNNVYNRLNTDYGAILMDPPYHTHAFDGALAVIYNAGVKENAGVFSQSQGWLILAEALLGHGNRAFQYFRENAPSMQNDRAEIRRIEPYCYGQFTEGPASPHAGRSHVHWLTGTASTVMVGCVEGILGMRPDLGGLKIAPSIPREWKALEIEKDFRGKRLHILVENPNGRESGCESLTVNGMPMEGNYVPEACLTARTEIVLTM
ncbi:N,N'-diacetylchitobiose phosphorylase [uncultured Oscillibacter sp.]|uniref:GH36-type glycosyl hydrolase domain-containing protein n=1 Tax=uncultured Oscillibacter sp. TaxID=876091 RepID=UPI0025CCE508|nr:N,N'-diacetylchitobiose phosphorylase [uncultured Oscillibacter sp.]